MGLTSLIVILSAFFVYWDCTRNNIGKISDEKSLLNNSAGIWAAGTCLLWIVAFPLYLIDRKKLKQKALTAPQVVSSLKRNATLGLFALVSMLIAAMQFSGPILSDDNNLLSDVSAVWRSSDGTIVMIDLENASNKNLQLNDMAFPVTIDNVDLANQVITVTSTSDDAKEIWSIQKIIQPDESFNVLLTLSNGVQDQLTFVRNNSL